MINHLLQDATLWRTTPDGLGGYTFAAPIKAMCRWENKEELLPGSDTVVSKAVVYLSVDATTEDYICLGKNTSSDPTTVVGAHRIASYKRIPSLRNLEILRKGWLV